MYKRIHDYGVIGNLETVALISNEGSIDWLCLPHLDSSSVFGALLDDGKGGRFSITPLPPFDAETDYLPGTNILRTRFTTESGVLSLTDFMPVPDSDHPEKGGRTISRSLYRLLEVESGEVEVEILFQPRFDYARADTLLEKVNGAIRARAGEDLVTLVCTLELEVAASTARGHWRLNTGDMVWFRLQHLDAHEKHGRDRLCLCIDQARRLLEETTHFWHSWLALNETGREFDRGPHKALLDRSALVLKLLLFNASGAIAAAATTSLPEEIGGVRNWDYRFTWIRDTSLTLRALFDLGHLSEMERYLLWIKDLLKQHGPGGMQIMYGLRGETELPEQELDHLEGYQGSKPVRIGNEAAGQRQLDIYGELMNAAMSLSDYVGKIDEQTWPFFRDLCNHVCRHWQEKDFGIWEVRGGPYHFVHSKIMCWVALDRGLKIAKRFGFPADKNRWRQNLQAIRTEVLDKGFCRRKQAFVMHYETEALDASALLIPSVGFLPWDDPRVVSTIEAVERELLEDGLLFRYRTADGLPGTEGRFLLCSFWLADCLVHLGRIEEAEELLERIGEAANSLGLFAEEYDPASGEALGNFPQAFTHIGLVTATMNLLRAKGLDRPSRPVPDHLRKGILQRILPVRVTLNNGLAESSLPPQDIGLHLKSVMNRLRGAFFDSGRGRVAYEEMRTSELYRKLVNLSYGLRELDPAALSTHEARTAFWINLYNVIVIHGVIEMEVRDSVKEVWRFFKRVGYRIGGHSYTPEDIEHGILRSNRRPPYSLFRRFGPDDPRKLFSLDELDPRIHFALVCASSSCPPIDVYTGERIDQELEASGRTFVNSRGMLVDKELFRVRLSRIFSWYAGDFGPTMADRLRYLARFLYDEEERTFVLDNADRLEVTFLEYDWRLNRGTREE
jgi:GH15 family glucan-1,4-alpha-glucosidase